MFMLIKINSQSKKVFLRVGMTSILNGIVSLCAVQGKKNHSVVE